MENSYKNSSGNDIPNEMMNHLTYTIILLEKVIKIHIHILVILIHLMKRYLLLE